MPPEYAQVDPAGRITLDPFGAVISLDGQARTEVRTHTDSGMTVAVGHVGWPVPLEGETVLSRWSAGLGLREDELAASIMGLDVVDNAPFSGRLAAGSIDLMIVETGLRGSIGPVQGSLVGEKHRLRAIPPKHAWAFWMPFDGLQGLSASKKFVGLTWEDSAFATREIKRSREDWQSPGYRTQVADFAATVVAAYRTWAAASSDDALQRLAGRLAQYSTPDAFTGRRAVDVTLAP